jgi:hypothetical protein
MMVSSKVVIPEKAGIEGVYNYLKIWNSAREFSSILFILIFLLTGCSSRLGKENIPELGFSPSPAQNSIRVPINSKINLFFNALLDPASFNPGLFILMDPSGKAVPSKIDYSPFPDSGFSVLTLTPVSYGQSPPGYLNINSVYTVTLGAGIKTLAGDAMTLLNVWSFATNNSTDITPPTFGGAISAEGLDMGSIRLTWGPAVDNPGGTPANNLVFSVCGSVRPTACTTNFLPIYVNPSTTIDSNGNFNFVLKPLKPETVYYFMVRVSDLAGNQDTNTVQVTASTKGGKLYVANYKNNDILGIDHPSKLSQLASQIRSIKASQNGLIDPYGIFYDQIKDQLFISTCNTNSKLNFVESLEATFCQPGSSTIAVYKNATTLLGLDQKPDWTIVNSPSGKIALNGPIGIFLDNSPGKDTLYIANFGGRGVTIYDDVTNSCQAYITAKIPCSVVPRANFASADLSAPFGIAFDAKKQLLYVSNYIQSFQGTDNSGNIIPIVPGTTVAVFDDTTLRGTVQRSAIKTIGGPNALNSPAGLWFDSSNDTLYIANTGAILGPTGAKIYPGIVAICNISLIPLGGVNPLPFQSTCAANNSGTQFLAGAKTGLLWPIQMAVTNASNSSSPSLYISDYSNNKVSVFSPNPLFSSSTVNNNTFPNEELFSVNSEIRKPVGITVSDSSGKDNLFLVNLGWDQILFFDQVAQNFTFSQCPGTPPQCTFAPARRISPSIFGPAGIFFNNSPDINGIPQDRLYVSNFFNNTIVVLDGASALTGNAYGAIHKIISSSALQNPFGIYVDTSQFRESVYVVNSRPDNSGQYAGLYAVVVFDLAQCPVNTGILCNIDPPSSGVRVIHSSDFSAPAGIWVDEGPNPNNQPRDILFVSNRGTSSASSPGYLTLFSSSSTLSGSILATTLIQGNQTSLFIPTGLFMDPIKDQLYVANQGYNDILVFNQPQNCTVSQAPNICNVLPDRTIYNTVDIIHFLDGPSSLAIDFSADQLYLANLGIYNGLSSLLVMNQASSINGQATISNSLIQNYGNSTTFQLNFPESIALDITR